ncbi:MAG: hypothetical protein WC867_07590 [Candidatus Pacearchaeota archaeon]|jgi:hypothetical protein
MDNSEYRFVYDYREPKKDIVLATFLEEKFYTDEYNRSSHDKIEFNSVVEKIAGIYNKKIFVPYKDIPHDWNSGKTYDLLFGVIIPESDMVICDRGVVSFNDNKVTSWFVECMVNRANELYIPVVHLNKAEEITSQIKFNRKKDCIVNFVLNVDAFIGIEKVIRNYYGV